MITAEDIIKHEKLLEHYVKLSEEYEQSRKSFAKAKYRLHVILTVNLQRIREQKSNVGIDMALLMLMEPGFLEEQHRLEVLDYYRDYIQGEEFYKGLENRIEATKTQIMYAQSVMKYVKDNT